MVNELSGVDFISCEIPEGLRSGCVYVGPVAMSCSVFLSFRPTIGVNFS